MKVLYKSYITKLKKIACSALSAVFIFGGLSASAAERKTNSAGTNEIPYESYTYWEDFGLEEKTAVYCKPMYRVKTVINADTLNAGIIESVGDICTDENGSLYILDSGASKIYITDNNYLPVKVIDTIVYNGENLSVKDSSGIFVKDGKIYIADTGNARVLVLDGDGIVTNVLTVPESELIPSNFNFRPIKVAVDSKNYTYVASDGSYYGALVYSPEMEFLGFYGANTVKATVLDVLQNLADRLFSNDEKKAASLLSLPYQFNDMVVGPGDFIYTATGSTGGQEQEGQICMMNPGGKNILGHEDYNFADTETGVYNRIAQTQNIAGIDVDSDGFFYALDTVYGRVFWYDEECNLLSVFGGSMGVGRQEGTFQLANAIAVGGSDVLVSDNLKNSVTVFAITDYGKAVRSAQLKTLNDDFDTTIEDWESVLDQDQNSQLAYRGLALAYYSSGDNEKAAEYSRLGADRETYSNAFAKLRQTFLEKWFPLIFFGVLLLAAGITVFSVIKRRRGIILVKNQRAQVMLSSIAHPFEAFRQVKEKSLGSFGLSLALLISFYIIEAVSDTLRGFAFNYFDASSYNSFYVLLSTIGLVLLWSCSNWLVCVLLGGIGKLKEIFIVTCYSLIPVIFAGLTELVLSHILVPDEFVFVGILRTFCILYTFFMLMVGTMKVHDIEIGKFFLTAMLTVIAMIIIVFLIFLIFLLAQQVYGWFYTIFIEIKFR